MRVKYQCFGTPGGLIHSFGMAISSSLLGLFGDIFDGGPSGQGGLARERAHRLLVAELAERIDRMLAAIAAGLGAAEGRAQEGAVVVVDEDDARLDIAAGPG